MNQSQPHTAIIVFSRSAEKEAEFKNFSSQKNFGFNKNVANGLINKTISLAKQTKLPLYVVDEKSQHGYGFGDKLSNSIEDHFAKGYQRLIIIGNDCIKLTEDHLFKTLYHLENNENVAGPTTNGGLYLIGINRHSFDSILFKNIRWQTEHVFNDFINYFPSYSLPESGDANNEHELKKQLQLLNAGNKLLQFIQSCFASFTKKILRISNFFEQLSALHISGLRAPPVLCICW